MKTMKRIGIVLLAAVLILIAVFIAGRYGWKLLGFSACRSAGLSSVEVTDQAVYISGFYPGSFPEGFCGYHAKVKDGTLYVGFRFSTVFGLFETGNFDIRIPVEEEIHQVVIKTSQSENTVWTSQTGATFLGEQYGVYVRLESSDVYVICMSYEGVGGGVCNADNTAMESGEYCFMDNDIMIASKEAGAAVPFTITVETMDGTVVASGEFSFDANAEKMYLTVTEDGRIVED